MTTAHLQTSRALEVTDILHRYSLQQMLAALAAAREADYFEPFPLGKVGIGELVELWHTAVHCNTHDMDWNDVVSAEEFEHIESRCVWFVHDELWERAE